MSLPPPRIPPPPVPDIDWSTPAAYLESCTAWLDRMQEWQSVTLPEWIEESRRHLLQRALADPRLRVPIDLHAQKAAIHGQPFATVAEMRLPAID